jgi:hypothetical protein
MMDRASRNEIVMLARRAHDLTESAYRQHPATRGEPDWLEKQKILLADMALHLLQTALRDSELSADELKRNLYSILTVSDQFLPGHDLKATAERLEQAPELHRPGA